MPHGAGHVVGCAVGAKESRGRQDPVTRVVDVPAPAVDVPGRREELHRPLRAGAADPTDASHPSLDQMDRGQVGPGHPDTSRGIPVLAEQHRRRGRLDDAPVGQPLLRRVHGVQQGRRLDVAAGLRPHPRVQSREHGPPELLRRGGQQARGELFEPPRSAYGGTPGVRVTEDRLDGAELGAGGARCQQPVQAWAPPRVPRRQRGPHARAGHGLAVLGTVPVTRPLEAIHGQRVSRRAVSASNTSRYSSHSATRNQQDSDPKSERRRIRRNWTSQPRSEQGSCCLRLLVGDLGDEGETLGGRGGG